MTAQEAYKILHPDTSRDAIWKVEYYAGFNGKEAGVKAVEDACIVACEALEKQIPKVATNIETHYIPESYETDYVTGNCPSCGASFADGDFDDFYCYKCGQLVSWDDE